VNGGGLAGAIGTEQSENFIGFYVKRQPVNCGQIAIGLDQVAYPYQSEMMCVRPYYALTTKNCKSKKLLAYSEHLGSAD
jgi:hypothetical protein